MRVDVVTIFPEYLAPLDLSLIGKARRDGLLDLRVHDLRDFTHDRHRTVDDTPYGGGAGMVMRPEPWGEALDAVVASGCRISWSPHRRGSRSLRPPPAVSPRSRGWRSPAVGTKVSTSESSRTRPPGCRSPLSRWATTS
jgi:tRNA (guanine37-N1)-methyltransferase